MINIKDITDIVSNRICNKGIHFCWLSMMLLDEPCNLVKDCNKCKWYRFDEMDCKVSKYE